MPGKTDDILDIDNDNHHNNNNNMNPVETGGNAIYTFQVKYTQNNNYNVSFFRYDIFDVFLDTKFLVYFGKKSQRYVCINQY
jgi:hypothetical protein